jgi:hypothetical protein
MNSRPCDCLVRPGLVSHKKDPTFGVQSKNTWLFYSHNHLDIIMLILPIAHNLIQGVGKEKRTMCSLKLHKCRGRGSSGPRSIPAISC